MQLDLVRLKQRLGQFGLNPTDWCVEIRAKRGAIFHLDISSVHDRSLTFAGWSTFEDWITLALENWH